MSEHTKTWRVRWRSTLTGETGHGKKLFYKHEAERWADAANREHDRVVVSDVEDTAP